jgi:hypothetical protein
LEMLPFACSWAGRDPIFVLRARRDGDGDLGAGDLGAGEERGASAGGSSSTVCSAAGGRRCCGVWARDDTLTLDTWGLCVVPVWTAGDLAGKRQ